MWGKNEHFFDDTDDNIWKQIDEIFKRAEQYAGKGIEPHLASLPEKAVSFPMEERKEEKEMQPQVEDFVIAVLADVFNILHFTSDDGNHIFIDNDPGYFKEKHIWKYTPEELKGKLLEVQASLSQLQR